MPSLDDPFLLYPYRPDVAAAAAFAGLFAITAVAHSWQCVRYKTWYFLPLVIATWMQVLGYIIRIFSAKNPTSIPLYIVSVVLILCAPTLMAASVYIILGRIMVFVNGEKYSLIRVSRLTKTFVWGDLIALNLQSTGAGMTPSDTPIVAEIGKYIVIVGLFAQILFFGLFVVTAVVFNRRIIAEPTPQSTRMLNQSYVRFKWLPRHWLVLLRVLYLASAFVMIRSIFRVVEYINGPRGYLASHEVFFYDLDGLMMLHATFLFNVIHPAQALSAKDPVAEDEIELDIPVQNASSSIASLGRVN
ncbi:RTA1 like protein-domain-containing protein [Flagelloscypha sp. PMI_526]|nr:RTA1 like protein-domain-containing protein [Flagelloscypha sp. PMI_526]